LHLYLLCYAWQRYRQLTDNLVEAFGYHMNQLERETKEESETAFARTRATVTIPSTNSHIGGKELKAFVSADFLKNSSLS
jgi:hypothetical protein